MPLGFQDVSTRTVKLTAIKLASEVEKAKCVLWFYEWRPVVRMQRRFCTVCGRETEKAYIGHHSTVSLYQCIFYSLTKILVAFPFIRPNSTLAETLKFLFNSARPVTSPPPFFAVTVRRLVTFSHLFPTVLNNIFITV